MIGRVGLFEAETSAWIDSGGTYEDLDLRRECHRSCPGILAEIRAHATGMTDTDLLDADSDRAGELPAEILAGELEVPKREVTRILHACTADVVRYVFDDSISCIREDATGVRVGFERSARTR